VFEFPFQRHRGWIALRQAISARLWQLRRTVPAAVAGRWRPASAVGRVPSLRSGVNGQARYLLALLRRKVHRYMQ
jgi:hypothetical protein